MFLSDDFATAVAITRAYWRRPLHVDILRGKRVKGLPPLTALYVNSGEYDEIKRYDHGMMAHPLYIESGEYEFPLGKRTETGEVAFPQPEPEAQGKTRYDAPPARCSFPETRHEVIRLIAWLSSYKPGSRRCKERKAPCSVEVSCCASAREGGIRCYGRTSVCTSRGKI
ncbi:hypothetical protein EJ07DRAFT_153452 [Lizonia empirigonia]|nr:hypothetical protein EJ07DRAFT_153452 [Lizonia empirigonia]